MQNCSHSEEAAVVCSGNVSIQCVCVCVCVCMCLCVCSSIIIIKFMGWDPKGLYRRLRPVKVLFQPNWGGLVSMQLIGQVLPLAA